MALDGRGTNCVLAFGLCSMAVTALATSWDDGVFTTAKLMEEVYKK